MNSERVTEILKDSLFLGEEIAELNDDDGPVPANAIIVEGVLSTFGFHPERLRSHDEEVAVMLSEMPIEFFPVEEGGGGGWSFLNLCMTRSGEQWTGLHMVQEQLLVLAIGLGRARFLLPREMWSHFPGGMPYVQFFSQPQVASEAAA